MADAPDPIEALRALVGRPVADNEPPWFEEVTADAVRHFALAYGDGNPLWSDRAYAAASPRGLVAPPLFPISSGVPGPDGDTEPVMITKVLGVRQIAVVEDHWTFHRPLSVGTRLERRTVLEDVGDAPDGDRRRCHVRSRRTYEAEGVLFSTHDRTRLFDLSSSTELIEPRQRATYTPDELAIIERGYQTVTRRGPEPRHPDSVTVGDQVGPLLKGPLTLTDLISYRAGVGPGPLGASVLGRAYEHRRREPQLYAPDESGVPDTIERRHWDEVYARSLGYATAYDYSHTRLTWFSHLLTDWMGDGGWVVELSFVAPAPAYLGDTHWVEGDVTSVDLRAGVGVVTITLRARNQLNDITSTGWATVLLPVRPAAVVTTEEMVAAAGGPGSGRISGR